MPRVHLRPVTVPLARALLSGDLSGVAAAPGWPHADTYDALRLYAQHESADGLFLVVESETERVVGDCGWFGPPAEDGEVEIGYGLAAASRGKGYGTEAVRALVAWIVEQPGVRRVVAEADATNVASRRVLERLGFTLAEVRGTDVRYTLPALPAGPAAGDTD